MYGHSRFNHRESLLIWIGLQRPISKGINWTHIAWLWRLAGRSDNTRKRHTYMLVSQLVSLCFEPSQLLWVTSGVNTNSNLSLSYSSHKSFNINHNISTAQLLQTYTHTKSHIFLQNHTLSMSQLRYFFTKNILQNTLYFIEHTNFFQVVKILLQIHISKQWIQRSLLKIFLFSLH